MNKKEAIEYNERIKNELCMLAVEYGVKKEWGSYIVDNHITVIPDDARKGMIFLGEEAASYKSGNIRIDLKNALVAGLELFASINAPENLINYIQLLIVSVFFIERAVKIRLEKTEAYIVYVLHTQEAYGVGIEEETVIHQVQVLYEKQEEVVLQREKIVAAVNRLSKIKAVELRKGLVFLAEKVWLEK